MSALAPSEVSGAGTSGRRLDRRVLLLWWLGAAIWAVAFLAAEAVLGVVFDPPLILLAAAGAIVVAVAALLPFLRYRRWRYDIRQRDLSLSKGALFYVRTLIPFDRIQFVESRQGPLDRVLGLNQIVVYTAAGRAGHIPGLDATQANRLREELSRVAGTLSV